MQWNEFWCDFVLGHISRVRSASAFRTLMLPGGPSDLELHLENGLAVSGSHQGLVLTIYANESSVNFLKPCSIVSV